MSIFNEVEELYRKKGYNIPVGTHRDIQETATSWLRGNVDDFHTYQENVLGTRITREIKTINLAYKVCDKWSKLLINKKVEKKFVNNKLIDKLYQQVLKNNNQSVKLPESVALAFGIGDLAMIEYINKNKIAIDHVMGNDFVITSQQNGITTGIVTITVHEKQEEVYTHLQEYYWENGINTVEHLLFKYKKSKEKEKTRRLGEQIRLSDVDFVFSKEELQGLKKTIDGEERYIDITETPVPLFQIIKPNTLNNHNFYSTRGLPIFMNAIDTLKASDIAYDKLNDEIELGGSRVFTDVDAQIEKAISSDNGNTQFIRALDKRKKEYVAIPNLSGENKDQDPIRFYNPTLRVDQEERAINMHLSIFGWLCGMGANFFKFENGQIYTNEKQVAASNGDLLNNKESHELILKDALEKQAMAIVVLINKINKGINIDVEELEYKIKFDDSLETDDETEYEKDLIKLEKGIISKKTFRERWEPNLNSEEEDKQIMSEQEQELELFTSDSEEDD